MNRILKYILENEDQGDLDYYNKLISALGYETDKDFFDSEEVLAFRDYVYSKAYRETLETLTFVQRSNIGAITLALKMQEPLGMEVVDYPNTIPDRD